MNHLVQQLIEDEWVVLSTHTCVGDAEVQWQRFVDAGIDEELLRIVYA